MSTPAGRMDYKVTFRRRNAVPGAVGTLRTGFSDYGACWAAFRENAPVERSYGGQPVIIRAGLVTTRDSAFIRSINQSDRVVVEEVEYEITSLARPVNKNGDVRITLIEAPSRGSYDRQFEQRGEVVTVRRIVPNAAPIEASARAIVTGYNPEELVAGINQGDRKVILSIDDLEAADFPLPLKANSTDRLIVRGRAMIIAEIDDSTHLYAGQLAAYQIRATG